ncbi:hypothetical protein NA57DRAFT_75600 [Rhizodiscina lignyota]|uniref:Uncharacterized protein n=1 Tax=Rhizodiscina lignyota TaxID=1504668 RepID=A0A9P4IHH6_9PEZI|nr:hypothetical protein NA57DRAFT_75600 [Rhizodiscina lignyota]
MSARLTSRLTRPSGLASPSPSLARIPPCEKKIFATLLRDRFRRVVLSGVINELQRLRKEAKEDLKEAEDTEKDEWQYHLHRLSRQSRDPGNTSGLPPGAASKEATEFLGTVNKYLEETAEEVTKRMVELIQESLKRTHQEWSMEVGLESKGRKKLKRKTCE